MSRINRQEIHLWLRTGASMMFNILSGELCVYMYHSKQRLGQQRVINQRKLANSRWTLSCSILLSLSALFSHSRNTETLNSNTPGSSSMHWCTLACPQDNPRWRAHAAAAGIPAGLFVDDNTRARSRPPWGFGSSTWSRHMEILHMILSLIMWSRRRL